MASKRLGKDVLDGTGVLCLPSSPKDSYPVSRRLSDYPSDLVWISVRIVQIICGPGLLFRSFKVTPSCLPFTVFLSLFSFEILKGMGLYGSTLCILSIKVIMYFTRMFSYSFSVFLFYPFSPFSILVRQVSFMFSKVWTLTTSQEIILFIFSFDTLYLVLIETNINFKRYYFWILKKYSSFPIEILCIFINRIDPDYVYLTFKIK